MLALKMDGTTLRIAQLDWDYLKLIAKSFVELKKSQHRFDGQGSWDMVEVLTCDVLEREER